MVLIFSSGSIELVVWSAAYEKFSSGLTPQFSTSIDVILSQNHVVWISSISKRSIDYKTCVISIPTVVQYMLIQCSHRFTNLSTLAFSLIGLKVPFLQECKICFATQYLLYIICTVQQSALDLLLQLPFHFRILPSYFTFAYRDFFFSFAFFSIFVFIVTLSLDLVLHHFAISFCIINYMIAR